MDEGRASGYGIFLHKDADIRIPAGGLRIEVREDGSIEVPPLRLEVALMVWPFWLDIALDHASVAAVAREELVAAVEAAGAEGSEADLQAALLGREFKAGMVAAAAAAFALDSFFGAILPFIPNRDQIQTEWTSGKTARHRRISDALRRTFMVRSAANAKRLREVVHEIFKVRDSAVHPSAEFGEPVKHDYLHAGVEWWFVAFGAKRAALLTEAAASIIRQCLNAPRRSNKPLVEWCESHKWHIEDRWRRARRLAGLDDGGWSQ